MKWMALAPFASILAPITMACVLFGTDAKAVDFDVDTQVEDMTTAHGQACFKKAWDAAQPNENQQKHAGQVVGMVKKVHEHQKPEIAAAAVRLHTLLADHPVNIRRSRKALGKLTRAAAPVQFAVFRGHLMIVNLLSKEQRGAFDTAYHACMKPN
jgi:hypothetical protein